MDAVREGCVCRPGMGLVLVFPRRTRTSARARGDVCVSAPERSGWARTSAEDHTRRALLHVDLVVCFTLDEHVLDPRNGRARGSQARRFGKVRRDRGNLSNLGSKARRVSPRVALEVIDASGGNHARLEEVVIDVRLPRHGAAVLRAENARGRHNVSPDTFADEADACRSFRGNKGHAQK